MSEYKYSVWIEDGLEANAVYLTLEEAKDMQYELMLDGYDSEIVNMKEDNNVAS